MANQLQVTAMMQRTDTTVKFPAVAEEFNTYQHDNYVYTGKIVYKDVHLSGDKLSKTMISTFSSQEVYDEYKADETVKATTGARDQYCKDNGLTLNLLIQELDEAGAPLSSRVVKIA